MGLGLELQQGDDRPDEDDEGRYSLLTTHYLLLTTYCLLLTGQMRKTNGAGVISVANSWLKALFVVGPTALVITVLSVATIGPMAGIGGPPMVIEIRPK